MLRKEMPAIFVAAFDLTFSLRPLPLCCGVTGKFADGQHHYRSSDTRNCYQFVPPPQQRMSGKRSGPNRSEEKIERMVAEMVI